MKKETIEIIIILPIMLAITWLGLYLMAVHFFVPEPDAGYLGTNSSYIGYGVTIDQDIYRYNYDSFEEYYTFQKNKKTAGVLTGIITAIIYAVIGLLIYVKKKTS